MKILSDIPESQKIPTKSPIDKILGGGVEKGNLTQFYGPPGSGKTNIAIKLAVETARRNKKAIFLDTEGGLSIERIKQISGPNFEAIADKILVFEPSSFMEQGEILKRLESVLETEGGDVDLIVLDSAVALYRLKEGNISQFNMDLGRQMAILLQMARKFDVAAVITNQIYSIMDDDGRDLVKPVGGTILRYWSKVIVELKIGDGAGERIAILKRHKSRREGLMTAFKIVGDGLG